MAFAAEAQTLLLCCDFDFERSEVASVLRDNDKREDQNTRDYQQASTHLIRNFSALRRTASHSNAWRARRFSRASARAVTTSSSEADVPDFDLRDDSITEM